MAAKKKSSASSKTDRAKNAPEKKPVKKKTTSKNTSSKKTTQKKSVPQSSQPEAKKAKTETRTSKDTQTARAEKPSSPKSFPVVGLGASAGGLEALEQFFRAMPADSGMAFVVVMHQAAKHVSLLPELLSRCTQMPVAAITNGIAVQSERVYIVPPGKYVDLLNNALHLSEIPPKHGVSLPIDHFFRSLADDRRELSVAIVLSGTGTDGTVGLSAVKGASGMVMVQTVESAKFGGMPQNAIDAGWPDYVLSPHEMPAKLIAYARGPFLKTPRAVEHSKPGISSSLSEILLLLRRRCGHDFSGYKPSTICRRIERRMNVHQIDEPRHYLRYLAQHESESELLFKDLLIGVTSFFRDSWAFDSLAKNAIMPMLKAKRDDESFRVWVPGCATGEEAYSIAILLRECMDELKIHLNVQIFATDLDNDAIETARIGLFPAGIGSDVSAARLGQFFTKSDSSFRIRKELRDWLVFAPQNVIHDPPFTKLDLVSCRNMLIYLQADLQKKLLALFHYALNSGGTMFLGTSESIGEFADLFDSVNKKAKIFHRKDTTHTRPTVEFPIKSIPAKVASKQIVDKSLPQAKLDVAIQELLAARFAPPTVIVNDNGEIIRVHGRTGLFLELAAGGPPKDVVKMAREGLELDLGAALRKAARETGPIVHRNVPVRTNGDTVLIDLSVERIVEPEPLAGLIRISFEIVTDVAPPVLEEHAESEHRITNREKKIELELQHTRESLQRSIEELDASNEEMKSTNEELQSTNEELQSTNEEMETSKEELQSLNEELQTVNAEFQEKINDLSCANDDMMNLLNATEIATIFLDNQLCIKRYTDQSQKVMHLIPTDVGRPLIDLTTRLINHDLVADAKHVLKTLAFKEHEVRCEDGTWLLMRIVPYRTSQDKIDGVVMSFVDINELKRNQHARDFARNIVETARESLLVLNPDLRVRSANASFYRTFDTRQENTIGELIYNLGNGQWDIPELRRLLEEILPKDSSFDGFKVQYNFPVVGRKNMILNARRIISDEGEPNSILLAIEDSR